jgi:hypothetical protein
MGLQMLHRAWENGNWLGDWEPLGGAFDSAPAVVSWGPNRLDIFGLGTDDLMYHKAWDVAPGATLDVIPIVVS